MIVIVGNWKKEMQFFFSSEFIVSTLTHECVLWYLSGEAKQIVFLKMEQDWCCRLKSKKVQFIEETCYFFGNFSISLEACGIYIFSKKVIWGFCNHICCTIFPDFEFTVISRWNFILEFWSMPNIHLQTSICEKYFVWHKLKLHLEKE